MDNFSRSDSLGGSHGSSDILDPTVAFGEGFANALSGMIMKDALYLDTGGFSQATVNSLLDLESDANLDTITEEHGYPLDGFYSESSVQEVVYDIYDSGTSDDDSIGLGFSPIYNVLINGQKNTNAFTSIFSFLYYLKQTNSSQSTGITSLALNENIGSGDEYDATNFPIYTLIPPDGSIIATDVDGDSIQTWDFMGPITSTSIGNKLYNRMFFEYTPTMSGCYTLAVTPTASGDLIILGINNVSIDNYWGGSTETVSSVLVSGEKEAFSVGSYNSAAGFTVRLFSDPSACL